ncbi:MAG: hypothetical protein MUC96_10485 [Myxococcaceae bacterium]|nr:hypothetical protein [Myxococcaceae bacterium]
MPIKSTSLAFSLINASRSASSPAGELVSRSEMLAALKMLGTSISRDEFETVLQRTGASTRLTGEARREVNRFLARGADASETDSYPAPKGMDMVMEVFESPRSQSGSLVTKDEVGALLKMATDTPDVDTVAGVAHLLKRLEGLPSEQVEAGVLDLVRGFFTSQPAPEAFVQGFEAIRGDLFIPGMNVREATALGVLGSGATLTDVRTALGLPETSRDAVQPFDDWAGGLRMSTTEQEKFEKLRGFLENSLRDVQVYTLGDSLYVLGRSGPEATIESLPLGERTGRASNSGGTYDVRIVSEGQLEWSPAGANSWTRAAIERTNTDSFWVAARELEASVREKLTNPAFDTSGVVGLKLR